jgi:predicted nuclease with TOPRIM domain
MKIEYITKRADKQDVKIERLYERVSQLEIQNALVNEKLSLLLEKLESVTLLKSDIDSIKSALSQQKEAKSFILSNLLNLEDSRFCGCVNFRRQLVVRFTKSSLSSQIIQTTAKCDLIS